ncbi:MAG: right-handed parallel beta-helix repeat-containing protein [Burkholderiales bacterium]|nr:right-handed parallel beta-helix repeat-containing protein [Burkholderiales bacterium]
MDRAHRRRALTRLGAILLAPLAGPAAAAEVRAGPERYREAVRALRPGDTLRLEPGTYAQGLDVHRLIGTADKPIVITGAAGISRSVLVATPGRNTISIVDSAFVRIADLDLDGRNVAVDAVKAEGTSRFAHHIELSRLRISRFAASQQNVGISTKCPAWNWTLRGNRIDHVGTGLYLGNSDGSAPFVRGVIEGNVVSGTRGYAMQIKHQLTWPIELEALAGNGETVIRYNTLAKRANSSQGELARPSLLLGHWPVSGRGSGERYLVYGNLLLDNPTEALFQAEGNVTLYNNVFVNRHGDGVAIREHNDIPREIVMRHNTVVARGVGVLLRNAAPGARQTVAGNAIFAGSVDPASLAQGNAVHAYDDAATYLRAFSADSPVLDLAPRGGRLADATQYRPEALPDLGLDFDRRPRGAGTFGAYAGTAPARPDRFRL